MEAICNSNAAKVYEALKDMCCDECGSSEVSFSVHDTKVIAVRCEACRHWHKVTVAS
jgi:hypothetical protein